MIYYYIAVAFIGVLDTVTFFLNDITALPFGLDNAMVTFVGTVKGFLDIMPWFVVPWYLMLFALSISVGMFVWGWVKYIINVIRGSGA